MTRPLLVSVSHGLDLLTFIAAVSMFGIAGESNGLMRTVYLSGGLFTLVALKAFGTAALAFMSQMRPRYLVPAAGAGIVGATVNLASLWRLS